MDSNTHPLSYLRRIFCKLTESFACGLQGMNHLREDNRPAYCHGIRGGIDIARIEQAQIQFNAVLQRA